MRTRSIQASILAVAVGAGLLAATPSHAQTATSDPADGAQVAPMPADAVVLRVDGTDYDRVVWPDGSEQLPFPTIGWAVAVAQQHRKAGTPVRVVIEPGTYRESISVGAAADDVPLVIEPEQPGTVVVSGADVTSWSPVPDTRLWSTPWTPEWGLAAVPSSWAGVSVPDGVRRRELVAVDGVPLRQVLDRTSLVPGSFYVDEAGDAVVVDPPAGASSLDGHVVEVATRPTTLRISGRASDVTVRGLTFELAAAAFADHMAYVTDATDVLLEGNTFRSSSWGGLGIAKSSGVTVRQNRAVDNGGNGIDTFQVRDALIEENTVVGTNQRGMWFGFARWSVAGSKHLHLHDAVLRENTYHANWARGLWLDTDVADVVVVGDRGTGNFRDGVFIEAVQGPLALEGTTWSGNGGAGILVGTSGGVTVEHSTMADNHGGQLVFSGDRQRSWTDVETGVPVTMGDFADWTLVRNTLSSSTDAPLVSAPVIPVDELRALLRAGELRSSRSTWSHPSLANAIQAKGGAVLSINEWNHLTGDRVGTGQSSATNARPSKAGATSKRSR